MCVCVCLIPYLLTTSHRTLSGFTLSTPKTTIAAIINYLLQSPLTGKHLPGSVGQSKADIHHTRQEHSKDDDD